MPSGSVTTTARPGAPGHLVVVGASLAGVRAAEALRRAGYEGTLTLVGAEEQFPPVDRPPLSKAALTKPGDPPDTVRVAPDLGLDLVLGRRATGLDVAGRRLRLDDDSELGYDGLVVATGASPRRLPDTESRSNVHVLRSLDDALRLRAELLPGRRVAIVGAGVLGCELAATCRGLGLDVSVVDVFTQPMLRVLGLPYAEVVAGLHRRAGVRLLLGRQVLGLRGDPVVDAVLLDGDEVVEADLVVVSIGVVPETAWLEGSGLELGDGLLCDEACFALGSGRTVVAAGDVARWYHPLLKRSLRVEHWTNAASQGQAAAQNLLAALSGTGTPEPYAVLPYYWSDQHGWKLQFVGSLGDETVLEEGAVDDGRFVVSYHAEGRLTGALCVNWPARVPRWRPLVTAAAEAS